MKAGWGRLSLRGRLAMSFGAMAAAALLFLLAIEARTIGLEHLMQGKILHAAVASLVAFFLGGWFVAGWCIQEIARIGSLVAEKPPRQLPAEIEGLAELLRREAQKHDRLLAELRRFTADAAHELKTPLTAQRTIGEVALRRPSDPAADREAIASMLEETARMNALIERLLRLARIESDQYPVRFRTLATAQALSESAESLAVIAEEKRVRMEIRCPNNLEMTADAELLSQVLLNLLDNAIRHSPEEGTVVLEAFPDERCVRIRITDQGAGIPVQDQEHIFERFYRADYSRVRTRGSFGLGLCIAKTAAQKMNGDVRLGHSSGGGASFEVSLPT